MKYEFLACANHMMNCDNIALKVQNRLLARRKSWDSRRYVFYDYAAKEFKMQTFLPNGKICESPFNLTTEIAEISEADWEMVREDVVRKRFRQQESIAGFNSLIHDLAVENMISIASATFLSTTFSALAEPERAMQECKETIAGTFNSDCAHKYHRPKELALLKLLDEIDWRRANE